MITVIENARIGIETKAHSIPKGTTFRGRIGSHPNRLFIKVYHSIVGLDCNDDGAATWDSDCTVEDYVPVDIEIRIL